MKSVHQFTLLLVDDSVEELRFLVAMLRRVGYKLVICRSGRDAIARIPVLAPDLILLDVRMPGMSGFAVLRILKQDTSMKHIPVIFLSAANDTSDKLEGLRLGAVDYISKPANEEEVLLRIGVHLRHEPEEKDDLPDVVLELDETVDGMASNILDDHILGAVCHLLEKDYAKDVTSEFICQSIGIGRHRLNEIFKKRYGVTVIAWWRERKMQRAKYLLQFTQMSVQAIADDLGFSAASNFSNTFSERFGVSPRDFRTSSSDTSDR